MRQGTKRIIVDVALVALLVFEMLYLVTGDVAHEIVGVAFFACLGVHLWLTRRMGASLFAMRTTSSPSKGSRSSASAKRALHRAIDIMLFACIALLLVSSILISNLLFDVGISFELGSYEAWALAHTASAYLLCGVVAFHAAFHWASLLKGMRVTYDPSRRQAITGVASACAALGAVAIGVASVDSLKGHAQAVADGDAGEDDGERSVVEDSTLSDERLSDKNASSGMDSSGSESSRKGIGRKGYGNGSESDSSTGREGSGPDASSGREGSGPGTSTDQGMGYGREDNGDQATGDDSGSAASGICTLCRKRCSLSAPRCDRPYRAGLI